MIKMTRLEELQAAKRKIESEIAREEMHLLNERGKLAEAQYAKEHPKWAALSEEQKNWCYFMGYDPDNPDVPTD